MLCYSVTAAAMIAIVSLLLVYTLKRLELPSYRVVITTGAGSVAVSLLFPAIFSMVSSSEGITGINLSIISSFSVSAAVSLVLIFAVSVAVSRIVPDSAFEMVLARFGKGKENAADIKTEENTASYETLQNAGNYLEDIFSNVTIEKQKETANFGESMSNAENNLEKSVDSDENTDKMGIETFKQDTVQLESLPENQLEDSPETLPEDLLEDSPETIPENLLENLPETIPENLLENLPESLPEDLLENLPEILPEGSQKLEDEVSGEDTNNQKFIADKIDKLQADELTIDGCIDEAFRLKQSGDREGAIIYYMYALDRKPGKDLVFWIVLDVCVLYKELNQVELAKDILTGYMENYSNLMSPVVREEIEKNLLYI